MMALSNIFREPRREITESAVGFVCIAGIISVLIGLMYGVGRLIQALYPGMTLDFAIPIGMLLMAFVGGTLALIIVMTHGVGEDVCDALERRGLQLRPRNRPR